VRRTSQPSTRQKIRYSKRGDTVDHHSSTDLPHVAAGQRRNGSKEPLHATAADNVRAVSSSGPYAPQGNAVAQSLTSELAARRSSPPELIAKTITRAVTSRRPKTRYAVGFGAKPLIFLHGALPDRTFDALIRRAVGMPSS